MFSLRSGHQEGPGRQTLYTHHKGIWKNLRYMSLKKNRKWRTPQMAMGRVQLDAYREAMMAPDAPKWLARHRPQPKPRSVSRPRAVNRGGFR